jgi:phenylpropionate dioxygenase-like ring-hydroxylating dioxygenase large terminal subunit
VSESVFRDFWHPVAPADAVTTSPVAVTLLDERLVVVRLADRVAVFRDLCIHRGTPLSLGWVDGEELVCAYHGWAYNGDGVCTRIPSLGPGRSIPRRARVDSYPAVERYGLIWTCLGAPRADIAEFPEFDDPEWNQVRFLVGPLQWACGAGRAVENFVDQSHFPWVHEGILGDRDHPEFHPVSIERHGNELRYSWVDRSEVAGELPERIGTICRPFTIHLVQRSEGGGRGTVLFFAATPHTATTHTNYTWVLENRPLTGEDLAKRKELGDTIMRQDQRIVEEQRPEELPFDLSEELHVKGPDAIAIEYRRFMAELGVPV